MKIITKLREITELLKGTSFKFEHFLKCTNLKSKKYPFILKIIIKNIEIIKFLYFAHLRIDYWIN